MAWSTRQLADLADTTIKTVRHYHRMGLLELPERAPNGYKQYQTAHLVRLLQIKRLTDLGLSLGQIRELGTVGEQSDDAIDALDDELAVTIERLQRIRAELAVVREHRAPLETPGPFGSVAKGLSERDRGVLTVLSGAFTDDALDDLRQLLEEPTDPEVDDDFSVLPADADDETIEAMAGRMAESIRRSHARFPWMADPGRAAMRSRDLARNAIGPAFAELFNAAQLAVLARASALTNTQS
ncbi:helix-turn-helix domain-containing protein [Prauserella cavernicola]|uniref:MerR family transcriptional regulator n=1 Tax=Prauserella cavernicola TaxID=2800127 RepID=A0A934QWB4_9PSEU|nr:MerR family transcriptional regulator [Prauserella cavernicola]MBK1787352.1 MerR family transcriptional regulator [Prauserella cavernicola]